MTHVVNRRTLLAGVAGAGLAAVGAPQVRAQALKGDKPLRVALLADIVNFDPMQFSSQNATVMRNLYDTLIDYDETGKPVPALAESFQIAPDNMSCTIVLRQGVVLHSGAAMTSACASPTRWPRASPRAACRSVADCIPQERSHTCAMKSSQPMAA